MDRNDVVIRIKEILIECLELENSPEELNEKELLFNGDLGFDSILTLFVIDALEEEFEIEFEDEEITIEIFETIEVLTDIVMTKLEAGSIS